MSGWRLWITVVVLGVAVGSLLGWVTATGPAPEAEPAEQGAEIVGRQQPGFSLPSVDGGTVSAEDFSGRAMLVNFWATWCAPCRREMPVLQAASETHGDALTVVGIAMDDAEPVQRFIDEVGVDYTVLVGLDEVIDTQREWGNAVGAMPYTVLVDSEGVVRWRHFGEVTESELDEALGEVL
jgi:peroxiredoxin